ncbi:hypothetical protein MA16_Dca027116 [Dendrobium catenatum]|uniref:Uncharacterized protein n=1 Tax=Dendrobium catenatum TaxID=906689 RepID=A0A2I0V960_9ASPA|nr:hypothetical protein MA16_Dca027116 [Dendrobium catenatum]
MYISKAVSFTHDRNGLGSSKQGRLFNPHDIEIELVPASLLSQLGVQTLTTATALQ